MPTGPQYLADEGQQTQQQSAFPNLNNFLNARGGNSPAAMLLKERSLQDREHMEGQRFTLAAQKLELEKVSELANIEKERVHIADSIELHRQTMLASKALSQLDGTEPDYQKKVLAVMADNPLASKDEAIKKMISFRNDQAMQKQRTSDALANFYAEHGEEEREHDREVDYAIQQRDKDKAAAGPSDADRTRYASLVGNIAQFQEAAKSDDPKVSGPAKASLAGSLAEQAALKTNFPSLAQMEAGSANRKTLDQILPVPRGTSAEPSGGQ